MVMPRHIGDKELRCIHRQHQPHHGEEHTPSMMNTHLHLLDMEIVLVAGQDIGIPGRHHHRTLLHTHLQIEEVEEVDGTNLIHRLRIPILTTVDQLLLLIIFIMDLHQTIRILPPLHHLTMADQKIITIQLCILRRHHHMVLFFIIVEVGHLRQC